MPKKKKKNGKIKNQMVNVGGKADVHMFTRNGIKK